MDKLVLLAKEIVTHVEELGLLCFPEAIDVDSAPLVVHWPGEDWKEFLAFVPALGVPVIYVGTTTFDYEEEDDPDELAEHDGQTDSVLVTYVAGGVVHAWSEFATWRVEAEEEAVSGYGEQDPRVMAFSERAKKEDWSRTIGYDRRFYAAEPVDRYSVGYVLLAELSGLPEEDSVLLDAGRWILSDAHSRLFEVRDALTDEGLSQKAALAEELARAHSDWSSMRVALREKYARTLVKETYGMALKIVADEVARYKPAANTPTQP